jgi:hypothetical protein
MSHGNKILILKVKNSYKFLLAKVAIISLNMKRIKRKFTAAANDLRSPTLKGFRVQYNKYKRVKDR